MAILFLPLAASFTIGSAALSYNQIIATSLVSPIQGTSFVSAQQRVMTPQTVTLAAPLAGAAMPAPMGIFQTSYIFAAGISNAGSIGQAQLLNPQKITASVASAVASVTMATVSTPPSQALSYENTIDAKTSVAGDIAAFQQVRVAPTGYRSVNFSLILTEVPASEISILFYTQDLTAIAGVDYLAESGIAIFPIGVQQTSIQIFYRQPLPGAPSKSFNVILTKVSGAYVVRGIGTCTIPKG